MKPLLITDCDEVLLHMVRHFGVWLDEAHDIDFTPNGGDFATSMRRRADQALVERTQMWALLDGFFPAEMDRQTLGAACSRGAWLRLPSMPRSSSSPISAIIAASTASPSLPPMASRTGSNAIRGPKGPPVARLVAELGAPVAVFVDDLAVHHESVAKHAPRVHRLHMIAEPSLAPNVPPAPHAHARIDDWREARDWIAARFAAGLTADAANG
jgi:hypothetical protein